jgi:hypothetical protein
MMLNLFNIFSIKKPFNYSVLFFGLIFELFLNISFGTIFKSLIYNIIYNINAWENQCWLDRVSLYSLHYSHSILQLSYGCQESSIKTLPSCYNHFNSLSLPSRYCISIFYAYCLIHPCTYFLYAI